MIRKAYLKKIEAAFEDWGDEISKLKREAEKAEKEAKGIYKEQLEVLRSKQNSTLERIRELREAGADDWGRIKSGVEDSMKELRKGVENAIEKLRKIA